MHDVAIVGAGPGGAAAAYYLAKAGLDVALLDKASFPREKTCGDGLTPQAVAVLEDMGALTAAELEINPIKQVRVFSPSGRVAGVSIPTSGPYPPFALVIPRLQLDQAVLERAVHAGAAFHPGLRVKDITSRDTYVQIQGESGRKTVKIDARFTIVATGANLSLLRRIDLLPDHPKLIRAVRGYFEGAQFEPSLDFRFDNVPLPGYGWVFSVTQTSANIGLGLWPARDGRSRRISPQNSFEHFIQSPGMRTVLTGAEQVGPIRGYPLRTDFIDSKTYNGRILLVGEAAGLVNPLTGEGIDYALESGKIAAKFLTEIMGNSKSVSMDMGEYDHRLRLRFQPIFQFSDLVRRLCMNRICLEALTRWAVRREDLRALLANIVLGNVQPPAKITLGKVMRLIAGGKKIARKAV